MSLFTQPYGYVAPTVRKKNVSFDLQALGRIFLFFKEETKIPSTASLSGRETEAYYIAQNEATLSDLLLCVLADSQRQAGLLVRESLSQFTASHEARICCFSLKACAVTRCIMLWLQFKFTEQCMSQYKEMAVHLTCYENKMIVLLS